MNSNFIEIKSLKKPFIDFLKIIDKAIKDNIPIKISNTLIKQKSNNAKLLNWLYNHKLIELIPIENKIKNKSNINSRARKIEISLQLKALRVNISDIAKRFNVKPSTVQGYFKSLKKYNNDYLKVLELVLNFKGISPNAKLTDFPEFPIIEDLDLLKKSLSPSDYNYFNKIINNNNWIKTIVGQNLGTYNVSILLPK
ncbi:MAG: hypothetical protein JXA99_11100 [Candidatus Lokiarchaeota archaeon]|nr:hypothetical protein [Candidatus Lokiarchaeota archaeon]